MFTKKIISSILLGSVFAVSTIAMTPTSANAGLIGKVTKAIIYPVRKVGTDASVDTHKALGHNSVQPAYGAHGAGPKEVVKPDGHVVPAG